MGKFKYKIHKSITWTVIENDNEVTYEERYTVANGGKVHVTRYRNGEQCSDVIQFRGNKEAVNNQNDLKKDLQKKAKSKQLTNLNYGNEYEL